MKHINQNAKNKVEQLKLIALFMKKMEIKVDQMVTILSVSPNTVYNYRTMEDKDLPVKVTERIFDILHVHDFNESRNLLENLSNSQRNLILNNLSTILSTKKILSEGNADKNISVKENECDKYDIGSKVYLEALLFEISKVKKCNDDYELIAYIKKYNK